MYRGSSFLLRYAYTINEGAVDVVLESRFSPLWDKEFGCRSTDVTLASLILELCQEIKKVYQPFAGAIHKNVSDILLTKVVLGTVGCVPAWDSYFHRGYRHCGFSPPSCLTVRFIEEVLQFCLSHLSEFQDEQGRIEREQSMLYPLMKLEDMYFHQIGLETEPGSAER
jgi:hypothetical protein